MCGSIELPNLCDKNLIPSMLLDISAASDKKKFFPCEKAKFFELGVYCWSGGRGQTNKILLSAPLDREGYMQNLVSLGLMTKYREISEFFPT